MLQDASELGFHLTPIGNGQILLEPSQSLDVGDPGTLVVAILERLQGLRAATLSYDLAGLALIDDAYCRWLESLSNACRAIGVRMVCVRMQPTAAFGLAQTQARLPSFATALDVGLADSTFPDSQ
ncbi:MAG: hypothetical protein M0037_02750 [Betaproteobacteria bacterium]|nr:hypothetical protein [Betaproteobacteria bacterium]